MQHIDPFRTAVLAGVLSAAFGVLIGIGFCVRFGMRTGLRWVQNWPSATTFLLSSYALAAATFVYVVVSRPAFLPPGIGLWVVIAFATVVAGFVVVDAYHDFLSEDLAPVILNRGQGRGDDAMRIEQVLRKMPRETRLQSPESKQYQELVRPFGDFQGLRSRANWIAYVLFLENLQAGLLAGGFLVYTIAFFWTTAAGERGMAPQQFVAILLLFVTWYPFRLYSQWYQYAIYKENFSSQKIFWVLLGVALIAGVMLFFIANPQGTVKVVAILFTAAIASLGAAKAINREWTLAMIGRCADGVAQCPFRYFALLYLMMLGLSMVVARSAFETPAPATASAATPATGQPVPTGSK